MAAIDNLEALDNKALREKCVEYGLPNVPITDTSRKLLIKRLRTAMEGGTKAAEKPKTRRETIHIIKVEQEGDKKEDTAKGTSSKTKPNTRRTIASVREPEVEPPRATVTQRRRSTRTTPISESEPAISHSTKRKVPDMIEESDDDVIPIPVIVEKPPEVSRQTRAASLSKSPVVTTSYVRDTPERSIKDEDEAEEEYEEDEEEDYEPEIEIVPDPIKTKYISSSRAYDASKPFYPVITREPSLGKESDRVSSISSRTSLSKAPTSTFSLDSQTTRRYVTGGFSTGATTSENKTFKHRTEQKVDSEEEEFEPQYLSDFAKRLSRLKAEPLDSGMSHTLKQDVETHRPAPRYYARPVTGRRAIKESDSVAESFKKFLVALDRKYQLRKNLIIAAIFLTILFVYILFF